MSSRNLAFLSAIVLSSACQMGCRRSPGWRSEQELLITQSIAQDLVTIPGDEGASPPAAFCVYGRSDAMGHSDPDRRLVALLRERGTWLYTLSRGQSGWTVDTIRGNKIY